MFSNLLAMLILWPLVLLAIKNMQGKHVLDMGAGVWHGAWGRRTPAVGEMLGQGGGGMIQFKLLVAPWQCMRWGFK